MSSFGLSAAALHGVSASIMAYGYRSLSSLTIYTFIKSQRGGHFQFLTVLGLSVAWITMVLSLILDLYPHLQALRKLKRAFLMVALPVEVVISSIYWTLVLFFPALILQSMPSNAVPSSSSEMPEIARIPLRMDLALHAVPAVSLLIDFLTMEEHFSSLETWLRAPVIVGAAAWGYASWVEHCASINGTFPYPFLSNNSYETRVKIYAGAAVFAFLSFATINRFHPSQK